MRRSTVSALLAAALGVVAPGPALAGAPPACAPGGPPAVMEGAVTPADARSNRTLPFRVLPRTTRVEVGYSWTGDGTVLDLGLWDAGGVGAPAGFRGWSGSRQGRVADGQAPVWVQADTAERGYRPGPVEPGIWHVDLGVAAVGAAGANWRVEARCRATPVGRPFRARPVDPDHVARLRPGWYHADFHMHGRHSHPDAPGWGRFVAHARAAGLDVLPVTEYVTDQHHRELGPVQRANPDLLIWPGREIVTLFGHASAIGETPSVVDWRHGAPGVSLRAIQRRTRADGALFQVNHPTTFPRARFGDLCRGCEFELGEEIDWGAVDTIEILTGPAVVNPAGLGLPGPPGDIQNPFMTTAIALWDRLLRAGHRITAVSGSDDKLGPGLGSSATAIHAEELSRPALTRAIRAGHAYVRTRGVRRSPSLALRAVAPDGRRGIFGDAFHAGSVEVTVRVRRGRGQVLTIVRDGRPVAETTITSDDFTHRFTARRRVASGPLGTAWRVQTRDELSLTTVGNPIFLRPASGRWDLPTGEGRPDLRPGAAAGSRGRRRRRATPDRPHRPAGPAPRVPGLPGVLAERAARGGAGEAPGPGAGAGGALGRPRARSTSTPSSTARTRARRRSRPSTASSGRAPSPRSAAATRSTPTTATSAGSRSSTRS